MNKVKLKKSLITQQEHQCAITGNPFVYDGKRYTEMLPLLDTDRIIPKAKGGTYTDGNTRLVDPIAHLKRHANFREYQQEYEQLRITIDSREQVRKHLNSINNRLLAMERGTDKLDEETHKWLGEQVDVTRKRLSKIDRRISKQIDDINSPVAQSARNVKGVGNITIAYMLIYINIEKAEYCSSLWSYVGLDKPSHERYTKGESPGGNKTLRTILYTMADSMIKVRGAYRDIYDKTKQKLEFSEKVTKTRNTKGHLVELPWKDTKPSHRHGAAIRQVMKHFLADWWYVHRKTEGLDTPQAYPIEKLGHKSWIYPEERGWIY